MPIVTLVVDAKIGCKKILTFRQKSLVRDAIDRRFGKA
jgi:hypothetical protein